jgi:hypothetical protein
MVGEGLQQPFSAPSFCLSDPLAVAGLVAHHLAMSLATIQKSFITQCPSPTDFFLPSCVENLLALNDLLLRSYL